MFDAIVDHCAQLLVDDLGNGYQAADEHVDRLFKVS